MLQIRVCNRKDAYQYVRIRLDTSEYVGYIPHTVVHTYTAMWLVVGIPAIRVVLGGLTNV